MGDCNIMQKNKQQPGTISVLIPSYGHADYIQLTLASIFEQSRQPYEVIVINDGSPDDTASAVAPFLDRIIYIEQENQGLIQSLNRGLQICTGDYVQFLASDDWLASGTFETSATILDNHPDIGLVHGGITIVDEKGNLYPHLEARQHSLGKHRDTVGLILGNYIFVPATLCRRKALEAAGPFRPYLFCQDWEMWLRIALDGWYLYGIKEPLAFYRRHASNISRPENMKKALQEELKMLSHLHHRFEGRISPEEAAAFASSKRQLLRALAWANLLSEEPTLARKLFMRLLIKKPDLNSARGLVSSFLPIRLHYEAKKLYLKLRGWKA